MKYKSVAVKHVARHVPPGKIFHSVVKHHELEEFNYCGLSLSLTGLAFKHSFVSISSISTIC